MIITIGNKLETIAAKAILGQNDELKDVLETLHWSSKHRSKVYPFKLPEFAKVGDFYLCGPSRNPPEGFIYNSQDSQEKPIEHQGQLFVGGNLITVHSVGCAISRGEFLSASGRTELVLPVYGGNDGVKKGIVGSVIDSFNERFNCRHLGEPLYEKYIVYESSVERQLVQDILKERYQI